MVQNSTINKSNVVEIKLQKLKYYTFNGIKYTYGLGEMAYGEWLVLKNGKPYYYVDIFREEFKDIRDKITGDMEDFLKVKLRETSNDLELEHTLFGIRSTKVTEEWFKLECLPIRFIE